MEIKNNKTIHYCNWAQQPDIGLICGLWTIPEWKQPNDVEGAYLGQNGDYYSFSSKRANCPKCLEAIKNRDPSKQYIDD